MFFFRLKTYSTKKDKKQHENYFENSYPSNYLFCLGISAFPPGMWWRQLSVRFTVCSMTSDGNAFSLFGFNYYMLLISNELYFNKIGKTPHSGFGPCNLQLFPPSNIFITVLFYLYYTYSAQIWSKINANLKLCGNDLSITIVSKRISSDTIFSRSVFVILYRECQGHREHIDMSRGLDGGQKRKT